jgi:hypothetical protein
MEIAKSPRANDIVRPFIMTGGRTSAGDRQLRVETVVQTRDPDDTYNRDGEQLAILQMCMEPLSIADVGSRLGLSLGVVKILVSDLIEIKALDVHHTDPVEIELSALTRMIERVRGL